MTSPKTFTIDARTILALGRDSIKEHTTALVELVKNSYDADAKNVEIDIFCSSKDNYIRIADNGCGMTETEVDKYWLRIGYSAKRKKRISRLKRRKTGEKGIGRISADRLGSTLVLNTKARDEGVFFFFFDWDAFEVDGKELSKIPIKVLASPSIDIPDRGRNKSPSGTELIINNLRQNWSAEDIADLQNELSVLISPFGKVKDFIINLKTDVGDGFDDKVSSPFYSNSEIKLDATYDKGIISYSITDKYLKGKKKKPKENIKWENLIQKKVTSPESVNEAPEIGPVKITLLFYTREAKAVEGSEISLPELRSFLDVNAGVKIYRDNIRVKPYGDPVDPEGDWLGLAERKTREPAAVTRPTWKVAANQIVGGVFLSRDRNPLLVDSAGREGLINQDAFINLKSLVLGCITLLEGHRHSRVKDEQKKSTETKRSPSKRILNFRQELEKFSKTIKVLTSSKTDDETYEAAQETIEKADIFQDKFISETQEAINELIDESRVLRGLATIGIAAAVFGHETQSSIDLFIASTYTASEYLKKGSDLNIVEEEIEKAKKSADSVSAWGAFALARVQRDKRRSKKQNIKVIIDKTVEQIESIFNAVNIDVNRDKLAPITGRVFAMDIEAVLLNLLTNSYDACKQKSKNRKIRIELKKEKHERIDGYCIIVADSGPGVDSKLKDKIWEPLFSTKYDRTGKNIGTGLGLSIIQSIVKDANGHTDVTRDKTLNGANFKIWLPFV